MRKASVSEDRIIEIIAMNRMGLFWQYPVITEKAFYDQNKEDVNYLGLPWATIIDRRYPINTLLSSIIPYLDSSREYYTCCQHIYFRVLAPLWKRLNIKTVYTPHKTTGTNTLDGIKIVSCPLYAVNVEDPTRNKGLKLEKLALLGYQRRYLLSFVGGWQQKDYLSDVRQRIFALGKAGKSDIFIRATGGWHFNDVVYNKLQNRDGDLNEDSQHKKKTAVYNVILLNSRYTLAPSGSGPNSIRFWEALGVGSIPVLLSDTLELPSHKLWDQAIIRIKESRVQEIEGILRQISPEEENKRRANCLRLYDHFKDNYCNR